MTDHLHRAPVAGDIWVQSRPIGERRLRIIRVESIGLRYVFAVAAETNRPIRPMTISEYRRGIGGVRPTDEKAFVYRREACVPKDVAKPTKIRTVLPRMSAPELERLRSRAKFLAKCGLSVGEISNRLNVHEAVVKVLMGAA